MSQKPVLAMLTAADRVPVSGLCSYLTTGCRRRPGAESGHAARTAAHKDRWDTLIWGGGDTGVTAGRLGLGLPVGV